MRRALDWIKGLFSRGEAEVVFGRKEVMEILPHRDRWLLLDSVTVAEGKAVGKYVLTEAICAGHIIGGILMAPGCVWLDAAAQLFAIIVHKDEEVLAHVKEGWTLAALRYDGVEFRRPIYPGDSVVIEALTEVDCDERHGLFTIVGGAFSVKVEGDSKPRVKIASVTLVPVDPSKLK